MDRNQEFFWSFRNTYSISLWKYMKLIFSFRVHTNMSDSSPWLIIIHNSCTEIKSFAIFRINSCKIIFGADHKAYMIYNSAAAGTMTNTFDIICTPKHTPRENFEKKNISNTYTSPYIITSLYQLYHYIHPPFVRIIGIIRFPETCAKLDTAILHPISIEPFDNLLYILFLYISGSDVSRA